jgi:hypothetical protein
MSVPGRAVSHQLLYALSPTLHTCPRACSRCRVCWALSHHRFLARYRLTRAFRAAPHNPSHTSLPDALSATAGDAVLLVDGRAPVHYTPGKTHRLSVTPGPSSRGASAPATWFLLDVGVGTVADGQADTWQLACNGTRASFASENNGPITMFWSAPPPKFASEVVVRLAAATAMGNLSLVAAVLRPAPSPVPPPPAPPPLPAGEKGWACTTSEAPSDGARGAFLGGTTQQCQSVPPGTGGALTLSECEARCFEDTAAAAGGVVFACARCAHAYDAERDGGGLAFEDLPASWRCPTYARRFHPWLSILSEMYLCQTCSCHEY